MSEELYGQDELEALITENDPVVGVVACLRRLWSDPNALDKRQLEKLEFQSRLLEQVVHSQYPNLYDDLVERIGTGFDPLADVSSGCCVIADALSLREGFQLERDLADEQEWDVELDWTVCPALPTRTRFATQTWFDSHAPSAVRRDDYEYIGGENIRVPNTDPAYVWMRFPDEKLHGAVEGRHVVEPIADVYDHTKRILTNIVEQATHDSVVVTSDHGYINFAGRNPYSLLEDAEEIFEAKFDGRFCEVVNSHPLRELEEQGYTVRSDGYYLVAGHYEWGRHSTITHGGVSLLECLTPVLRIDKQSTSNRGDSA